MPAAMCEILDVFTNLLRVLMLKPDTSGVSGGN